MWSRRWIPPALSLLLFVACRAQPSPEEIAASDTRTLLTWDTLREMNNTKLEELCEIEVYEAPATTTAEYTSDTNGVTAQFPYNPKWGTREHKLPAYYELPDENAILFGPIGHGEVCSLIRYWEMKIVPPRTAEEAFAASQTWMQEAMGEGKEIPPAFMPKLTTIGDHAAIEYVDIGLCSYPTIEVVGKKYNYKLSYCAGGADREKDLMPLREIVEGMEIR